MKRILILCACAAMLAACGKNNEANNGTNNGTANNGTANNGTVNNGGNNTTGNNGQNNTTGNNGNNTTGNNGTANNTTGNNGTVNNTTGGTVNNTTGTNNNTTGTNNNTTGTNNTNNMTMGETPIHGCTSDAAVDMTGQAAVSVSDIQAWSFGHDVCVKVSVGTVVSWSGNFTQHPLTGGETPTPDAGSPITVAAAGVTGNDTVDVTFDTAGAYPYYCVIHTGSMTGVVYVVP